MRAVPREIETVQAQRSLECVNMHTCMNPTPNMHLTHTSHPHTGSIAFATTINAMAEIRQKIKDKIQEAIADPEAAVRQKGNARCVASMRGWMAQQPKDPCSPAISPPCRFSQYDRAWPDVRQPRVQK